MRPQQKVRKRRKIEMAILHIQTMQVTLMRCHFNETLQPRSNGPLQVETIGIFQPQNAKLPSAGCIFFWGTAATQNCASAADATS